MLYSYSKKIKYSNAVFKKTVVDRGGKHIKPPKNMHIVYHILLLIFSTVKTNENSKYINIKFV